MRHLISTMIIGLFAAVSPSAQDPQPAKPTGTTGTSTVTPVTAKLTDAQGRSVGEARLQQTNRGVLLKLELRNAPPGLHALHIHEVGRCDAPSFESAGDHFAPSGREHGFFASGGPHAGDLPNIDVPGTGGLSVEHLVPDVTLEGGANSLLDANGSALVMHAAKDDYSSDPAGNSGDRIACARITR